MVVSYTCIIYIKLALAFLNGFKISIEMLVCFIWQASNRPNGWQYDVGDSILRTRGMCFYLNSEAMFSFKPTAFDSLYNYCISRIPASSLTTFNGSSILYAVIYCAMQSCSIKSGNHPSRAGVVPLNFSDLLLLYTNIWSAHTTWWRVMHVDRVSRYIRFRSPCRK